MDQNRIDELIDSVSSSIIIGKYLDAISTMEDIADLESREYVCTIVLLAIGMAYAGRIYEEIHIVLDLDEYERAKHKSSNALVIYHNPKTGEVDGLESLLGFIPIENPIRAYYARITNQDPLS